MKRFEYKVIRHVLSTGKMFSGGVQANPEILEAALNEAGRDGWQVATSQTTMLNGWSLDLIVVMQRPLSDS